MLFAFLILAGSVVKDMLDLLATGHLTFGLFFRMVGTLFPYVFVHALPLGILTGILLTMGRLSSQSEVTAFRASGVSVFRLSGSVYFLAVIGTMVAMIVNFYFGPIAKAEYRRAQENIIQKNPLGYIVEKTFVKEFPKVVVYVSDKEGSRLRDLWVWKLDSETERRVQQFFRAETGYFDYDEEKNSLNLVLENAQVEVRGGDDPEDMKRVYPTVFQRVPVLLSLDGILGKKTFQRRLRWMTFQELHAEKAKWSEVKANAESQEEALVAEENIFDATMHFHSKFASSFSVISFAVLAIPLGIRTSRKETSANLFLALGLGLAFYLMSIAVGWLGSDFVIPPQYLYWLPNFAYQGIGFWLLYKIDVGRRSRSLVA